jgi:2-polyprenyl-3-methyl-5-hydroxy-6-metoxy-1,4-benzoquinol methylase
LGKFIIIGNKKLQYYKDILIKADLRLHEQIADNVKSKIPVGSLVLDFGAGEGALSERLADSGYKVISADINGEEFKSKNAKFYKLDFNDKENLENFINEYREKFDLIISAEIIEHIENPWEYIRTIKLLLKKGGMLLITTPNTTSWLSRMYFLFEGKFHQFSDTDLEYGHISPITKWELNNVLKHEGFTNIEFRPAGTLPFIWVVNNKKVLFYNFVSLFFRPFMWGLKRGWVLMCTSIKE